MLKVHFNFQTFGYLATQDMADMEIDYKGNMADIDSILTDYLYLQEYRKEKAQEVLNYHQDLNNELGI